MLCGVCECLRVCVYAYLACRVFLCVSPFEECVAYPDLVRASKLDLVSPGGKHFTLSFFVQCTRYQETAHTKLVREHLATVISAH